MEETTRYYDMTLTIEKVLNEVGIKHARLSSYGSDAEWWLPTIECRLIWIDDTMGIVWRDKLKREQCFDKNNPENIKQTISDLLFAHFAENVLTNLDWFENLPLPTDAVQPLSLYGIGRLNAEEYLERLKKANNIISKEIENLTAFISKSDNK